MECSSSSFEHSEHQNVDGLPYRRTKFARSPVGPTVSAYLKTPPTALKTRSGGSTWNGRRPHSTATESGTAGKMLTREPSPCAARISSSASRRSRTKQVARCAGASGPNASGRRASKGTGAAEGRAVDVRLADHPVREAGLETTPPEIADSFAQGPVRLSKRDDQR